MVLRFVMLFDRRVEDLLRIEDFGQYLTNKMTSDFSAKAIDHVLVENTFRRTFAALNAASGENALKKYSSTHQRFSGTFLISAFEMIALGVAANLDYVEQQGPAWLDGKIKAMWSDPRSNGIYGMGVSTARRLPRTLKLGREYFAEP